MTLTSSTRQFCVSSSLAIPSTFHRHVHPTRPYSVVPSFPARRPTRRRLSWNRSLRRLLDLTSPACAPARLRRVLPPSHHNANIFSLATLSLGVRLLILQLGRFVMFRAMLSVFECFHCEKVLRLNVTSVKIYSTAEPHLVGARWRMKPTMAAQHCRGFSFRHFG